MDIASRPTPEQLVSLAARIPQLIRLGTSSWTYPGWKGLIYSRDYPRTGSTAAMLAEYAQYPLFGTVGIDSFFYGPPSPKTLQEYAAALPPGFPCVMKIWDRISVATFESPKSGKLRGQANPDFLNADMLLREVIAPLREHFEGHIGPLVFEFQQVRHMKLGELVNRLDAFFGQLPTDLPYAVEIRNAEFLQPEYFALLREHRIAHVFNSWTAMPRIGEQLLLHDAVTAPFIVARALLQPGRKFADAAEKFAPFDRIHEASPALRSELVALVRTAIALRIPAYIIAGNRAEGCSPLTIAAVVNMLAGAG